MEPATQTGIGPGPWTLSVCKYLMTHLQWTTKMIPERYAGSITIYYWTEQTRKRYSRKNGMAGKWYGGSTNKKKWIGGANRSTGRNNSISYYYMTLLKWVF